MQSRQALLTFVRTTWFSDSVVAPFSLKTFFWFARDSSLTSWKYFSTHSTNIMTSLDIQSSEVSPDNIPFASLFIQGVAADANEKNTSSIHHETADGQIFRYEQPQFDLITYFSILWWQLRRFLKQFHVSTKKVLICHEPPNRAAIPHDQSRF